MNIYSITKYLHEPQDNIMRVKIKIAVLISQLLKKVNTRNRISENILCRHTPIYIFHRKLGFVQHKKSKQFRPPPPPILAVAQFLQ